MVALKVDPPNWIIVFIAVILALACLLYLAGYVFFGIKSPDALRSEKFTLSKLAIERSVTGDNLAGFIDPAVDKRAIDIPASTPKKDVEHE